MVAKARAQLGLHPGGPATGFGAAFAGSATSAGMPRATGDGPLPAGALLDLAGSGTLNPNPGWGPYRTAGDAELRTYTSAELKTFQLCLATNLKASLLTAHVQAKNVF